MVSFLFFFTFFLFLYINVSSAATDTISGDFTLSGDKTILSSGGTFRMGFFRPGSSSNFYIGMWYENLSQQTIVWVANRDKPVSDKNSSILKISNGNLILLNEKTQSPVWSTNLNSTTSETNLKAVLLDDGNLVLRDEESSSVLWQSFDHLCDTWLPGAKIRFNKRTGKSQRLTSWKNLEDPSPGLFSLELDESTSYKIIYNESTQYWSSGPWNPQSRIFESVPEMRLNFIYDFSFVSNATEMYFTYSIYNHSDVARFAMDVSGQIKQFSWLETSKLWNLYWSQPRQQCQVYSYCGSFGICNEKSQPFCHCPRGFRPVSKKGWDLNDYSSGCVRNTALQCSRGDMSSKFLPLFDVKLPDDSEVLGVNSVGLCGSECLRNCSCKAYAYDEATNRCLMWSKDVLNLQQLDEGNTEGSTLYLRLDASDMPNGSFSSGKSKKAMIIGAVLVSLGVLVLVLLVVILILKCRRRRKRMVGEKSNDGTLTTFSYRELQHATKNFLEKLGGGGFGSVFKGVIPESTDVAVKRLESVSQGEKQFRTEVVTIGTIQHVNLVRLRGFCAEGSKKLLVYDYMPNGSLDSHLFIDETEEKTVLSWTLRYQIALGTARGLAYLHDECRDCIIHCDIKPENILLDSKFCPKVADFGLAKLVGRDFSRVLTTMRGTRGYLAPEWISGVAITPKADVYSYGMMLLELVSGRRNTEQREKLGKVRFFPSLAATVLTKDDGGDILSLLDPRLKGETVVKEEVMRACKVACWCIQDEESHRPTMSQVVQILEGVLDVNTPPFPRSIQALVDNDDDEDVVFFTEQEHTSSTTQSSSQKQNHSSSTSSKKTSNSSSLA